MKKTPTVKVIFTSFSLLLLTSINVQANDTESTLSASSDTFTGDITANIIYANVYYHFFANNEWHLNAEGRYGFINLISLEEEIAQQ